MKLIKPKVINSSSTFARSSVGYYINSEGILVSAGINTPRVSYNPADLTETPVILIESESTNLALYSADFSNAIYTMSNTTVSTDTVVAPTGVEVSNNKLVLDSTLASTHYIEQVITVPSSTNIVISILVKAAEKSQIAIESTNGSLSPIAYFDVSLGTILSSTYCTAVITEWNNGWYRCSISFAMVSGTSSVARVYITDAGVNIIDGDGVSGLYLWGLQVESGRLTASTIIPTTLTQITRSEDTPGFYSNVPITEPLYSASNTYAEDDFVYLSSTNKVYQSLQSANTGHNPLETDSLWWYEYSAINRCKPFDKKIGSQVEYAGDILYTFNPGIIEGVAFFNIENIVKVHIMVTDATTKEVVYNSSVSLASNEETYIFDWYSYFFSEFQLLTTAVRTEIPPYENSICAIQFIREEGTVAKVGEIVLGKIHVVGSTQYAPEISIIDYSKKTTDVFGNYTIIERAYSKRVSASVVVFNKDINWVQKLISEVRATPIVWIVSEEDSYSEGLIVYGYYKDFSIVIPHPIWSEMNLQIEGLI